MTLSTDELQRYARHIALPEIGLEGQMRLREASVLIIGAGGLGSPVALYLAAAGVGTIGIADADCVDASNLQRQIIHDTPSIGRPKVDSAADRMKALNPGVAIVTYHEWITAGNIQSVIAPYDFIIDATDSLDTKFLVDDACHAAGKPYSHGAISSFEGQTMTILPSTVRFSDLFPDGPEAVERNAGKPAGPFGVVPGILGCIQAAEAIKWITGTGQLLTDCLLRFDVLTMQFTRINLR